MFGHGSPISPGVRSRPPPWTLRSPARRAVGLHPPNPPRRPDASGCLIAFRSRDVRPTDHSFRSGLHPPTRTTMPSADFSDAIGPPCEEPSPPMADTPETSRGKFDRLRRTPAESTPVALDEYGLRGQAPARPTIRRRRTSIRFLSIRPRLWLPASFRPRLAATPLRFARTSPPSGCAGDLHPPGCRTCSAHAIFKRPSGPTSMDLCIRLRTQARPEARAYGSDGVRSYERWGLFMCMEKMNWRRRKRGIES